MKLFPCIIFASLLIFHCYSIPSFANENLNLFDPEFANKLFADDIMREKMRLKRLEDDRVSKEIAERLSKYGQFEGYEYFDTATETPVKSEWEFFEDPR